MTEIIAIVNEKGGTGKTTTAVNLSAALGELGRKVLLVDLDGQAASSRWLGVEDDTRFADALWSGEAFAPIPEVVPGVSLAPGSGKLDSVAHDLRPTQGGQLRKVLQQLPAFDHVIIDCPPSLGNRLIGNALLAATHAIVPVEASILALDGLKILLTTFQDVRDGFGHDIALRGVLACRYDARTRLSRLVLAELNRALPGRVFQTVIRENIRMRECPGSGTSILTYAPGSHAAEDYRLLAKEFLAAMADSAVPRADGALGDNELSDEECQAILDIRGQVKAMLQSTEARLPRPAAGAARPGSLRGVLTEGPGGLPDEDEIEALAQSVKLEGPPRLEPLPPPPPEALPVAARPTAAEAQSEAAGQPETVAMPQRMAMEERAAQEPSAQPVAIEPPLAADAPPAPAQPATEEEPQAPDPASASREEPWDRRVERRRQTADADTALWGLPMRMESPEPAREPAPEPLPAAAIEPAEGPQADALSEAGREPGETPMPDQRAETNEYAAPGPALERSAAAVASQPQTPSDQKDSLAALRTVLESIKKQSVPAAPPQDAKKEPVWRRLFNKRSA